MSRLLAKITSKPSLCRFSFALFAGLAAQPLVLPICHAQVPLELRIADEIVPPGGMLQLKVEVTESKPILKGRQGVHFASQASQGLAGVPHFSGLAIFSVLGDASGVAVLSPGSVQFYFSSPLDSMGMDPDFPVLVMDTPISKDASRGTRSLLTFDLNNSEWFDPNSQEYPVILSPGELTIDGNISISSVSPGGVVVPAGKPISIKGIGFNPDAKVDVSEADIATSKYVSSKEIQITLKTAVNLEHRRVRVTNKSTNERVEYFPYQRTKASGSSINPLMAASYPLFSDAQLTVGYFKPVLEGTTYSGLALRNISNQAVSVRLDLHSAQGDLLARSNFSLSPNTYIVRDLAELFPGFVADDGTTVKVRAKGPIQGLGLIADDSTGDVLPVELSATP